MSALRPERRNWPGKSETDPDLDDHDAFRVVIGWLTAGMRQSHICAASSQAF